MLTVNLKGFVEQLFSCYSNIAFTEMLILLFICILGKLSLTRDLASASANK